MTLRNPSDLLQVLELTESLAGSDAAACCAALYANPAVRWIFGDELHPGGAATTRRALQLIGARPGELLLDVAAGRGDAAILAAREFGCIVTGIDYGAAGMTEAERAAETARLADQVTFRVGDAEVLPFGDASFDAVLCECSLCLFGDKRKALSEVRRVLRPGGRFAVADVLREHDQWENNLHGPLPAVACIETALSRRDLWQLLDTTGFDVIAEQPCTREAAHMAERVHDRLRGARIVVSGQPELAHVLTEAIAIAREARDAIERGALDYAIVASTRRASRRCNGELSREAT